MEAPAVAQPRGAAKLWIRVGEATYDGVLWLLYLALDGVAPRAKMNQQRGRRYLAASNRAKEAQEQQRLAAAWAKAPPAEWDHNAITPGTAFMHRLGECLRYYCADRVARPKSATLHRRSHVTRTFLHARSLCSAPAAVIARIPSAMSVQN